MKDINKMPTAHSGKFARPNRWAIASQAKEPEFNQCQDTDELKLIED